VLEISLPRYYQLEQRALAGLVAACEPAPRGPRVDLTRRIRALEREKGRLQRECDRQQALVRAAQRTLGLTLPSAAKSPVPGKEAGAAAKRRRNRRPSVRALKAVRALQVEQVAEAGVEAIPEVAATPAIAGA
jgi:predicted secreted Zn-dependent protease